MSLLQVTIVADGTRREFTASGDGPVLVAAFRTWLSSPDLWLPICEGADTLDRQGANLEQGKDAPVPDPAAGDVLPAAEEPPALKKGRCKVCNERYAQELGMCRQCWRNREREQIQRISPVTSVPVPAAPDADDLTRHVHRVLVSGASLDPKEIWRAIQTLMPTVDLPIVERHLNLMALKRKIDRLSVGLTARYRKLATTRAAVSAPVESTEARG